METKSHVFTHDPISNLKLVLEHSPQLSEVFQCLTEMKAVIHGGFVRELCRCTSLEEFLSYLADADLDVVCQLTKQSWRHHFNIIMRRNFQVTQSFSENYPENILHGTLNTEYESSREAVRNYVLNRMDKKTASDEKQIELEIKKLAELASVHLSNESWKLTVEFAEAKDPNTYLENSTDVNINSLMLQPSEMKLSVKPNLKFQRSKVISNIKKGKFHLINREFFGTSKATSLILLFVRVVKMTNRHYQCDFDHKNTQKLLTKATRAFLSTVNFVADQRLLPSYSGCLDIVKIIMQLKGNSRLWKDCERGLIELACECRDVKFLQEIFIRNKIRKSDSSELKQMLFRFFQLDNFDGDLKVLLQVLILGNIIGYQLRYHKNINFIQETGLLELLTEYLVHYSKNVRDINQYNFEIQEKSVGIRTVVEIIEVVLTSMGAFGNLKLLKDFIAHVGLNEEFITQCLVRTNFFATIVRAGHYELVEFWISLKNNCFGQYALITEALLNNDIRMAELLRRNNMKIIEDEFDLNVTIRQFLKLVQNPDILAFLKSCQLVLTDEYQHALFIVADCKQIDYLHQELKIPFTSPNREQAMMYRDYQTMSDKLFWCLQTYPILKRSYWLNNTMYSRIVVEHPLDVVKFRKTLSVNFILEMIFYNCAENTRTPRFAQFAYCVGSIYVANKDAQIGWRLKKFFQGVYHMAVWSLLRDTFFGKMGSDLAKHVGKFLYKN